MRIAVHDYAGHLFQFGLSDALARRGHVVTHFYFADDPGPKGAEAATRDHLANLSIQPISTGAPYSKSDFLQRRRGDIGYGHVAAHAITAFRPHVVISGNTPLDAQRLIARSVDRAGAAFVFWMQDFFSLAIDRLLRRRWMGMGWALASYYGRIEKRLLQSSDAVVLISEDFLGPIDRFNVPIERLFVIPNWGALESIPEQPKANAWAKAHGLSERFVYLYSGTLALKHNPERLWSLAETFRSDPDVAIVLAASGVSLDALKARNESNPQPNLVFLPLQPAASFPALLGAADVLVALLEHDAGEFSVPSKVLSYMCAGRPILLSAPRHNLAARIVADAGAGFVASATNESEFLEGARRLRRDVQLRRSLGEAGRRYAESAFDIEAVTDRFEHAFEVACRVRASRSPIRS